MNELWMAPDWRVVLAFAGIGIGYPVYQYWLQADAWRARLTSRYSGEALEISSVFAQRIAGGLWLGGVAVVTACLAGLKLADIGLAAGDLTRTLIWLGACALLLPLIARGATSPANIAHYPQMKLAQWPAQRIRQNALAWGAYLLGYELFFRGLCLAWFTQTFGMWGGILTTTVIYAYAHLQKNAGETFGSLIVGVIFALMTLHTGAIWAAFLLHWMIAVTGETAAIYKKR